MWRTIEIELTPGVQCWGIFGEAIVIPNARGPKNKSVDEPATGIAFQVTAQSSLRHRAREAGGFRTIPLCSTLSLPPLYFTVTPADRYLPTTSYKPPPPLPFTSNRFLP